MRTIALLVAVLAVVPAHAQENATVTGRVLSNARVTGNSGQESRMWPRSTLGIGDSCTVGAANDSHVVICQDGALRLVQCEREWR